MAAEETNRSKGFEVKGFLGPAMQDADQVERRLSPLTFGELTGGRRRLFVEIVDDECAIAEGPGVGLAFDAHFGDGADAALFFRNVEVLDECSGSSAYGADDGATKQLSAVLQFDA